MAPPRGFCPSKERERRNTVVKKEGLVQREGLQYLALRLGGFTEKKKKVSPQKHGRRP